MAPDEGAGWPAAPGPSRELLPELAVLPGHLLWRAHARVGLALAEVLPPGVDLNAYAVLLALVEDGAHSQQDLADLLGTSRTTLARVAGELTGSGLVERVRNAEDRRSYVLTRTDAGARAAGSWRAHVDAVEERLTAGLAPAEHRDLVDLLGRVLRSRAGSGPGSAPTGVPAPLRGSLALLVSRIHVRVHRDFLDALAPLDLEPRLFGALTALGATGPVAQAELARALGTSGASVVAMTDAMERHGLVERRRDPADRRTQLLHLTDAAPAVREEAGTLAAASLAPWLAPLTREELERLVGLLQRFVTGG